MRKIILLLLLSVFAFAAQAAELKTITLSVDKMTCNMCPISIRHRVLKMKGVHKAVVKRKTATAKITYEDTEATPADIAGVITKLGYPAEVKEEGK